jgi:hypothetical protein
MSTACAECGRVSPGSPSDYFCSDVCQQHWYARRTTGPVTDPGRRGVVGPEHLAPVLRRWQAA